MGHDSEATTQKYYGVIGDDERRAVFQDIGDAKAAAPPAISDEQKITLVDKCPSSDNLRQMAV
ncbi:hypothetical protein [Shimia sp. SK013]|uniref:hypothetical protein n=1 Tax=Shimia sp. SK013 TaxID=1389006 RepID=UPI00128F4A27|nr:hypothetical protein [Shimia sp. SK013]